MNKPRLMDQVRDVLRVHHTVAVPKKPMCNRYVVLFSFTTSDTQRRWVSRK